MADDNLERHEVDLLIKDLAAARSKAILTKAVPATPPASATGCASAPTPATPSPVVAPPAASRARHKTFVSAINLPEGAPAPVRRSGSALATVVRWPTFLGRARVRMPEIAWRIQDLLARVNSSTGEVTQVRVWVALGVMLAIAMPFWPYPKVCNWWLLLYMLAVGMVVVAGIWGARLTWQTRLGIAHTVALFVVLWGITLGAQETLPRIGYAKAEATWICP